MTGLPSTFALESVVKRLLNSNGDGSKPHYLLVARLENQAQIETSFGIECVNGIIVQMADTILNEQPDSIEVYRVGTESVGFIYLAEDEYAVENLNWRKCTRPQKGGWFMCNLKKWPGLVVFSGFFVLSVCF